MGYRLAPTVRACRTERDDLIFLDLAHDRYLAADGEAREALLNRLDWPAIEPSPALAALHERGLLIFEPDKPDQLGMTKRETAASMPAEIDTSLGSPSLRDVAELAWVRMRCASQIRRRGMQALQHARTPVAMNAAGAAAPALIATVGRLIRARSLLPLEHSCLLDSLTLRTLLRGQGMQSEIVVGVQARPFKAHCWAEAGGLVLNDDPDALRRFTPILVS
jgi:hypothetical protein